MAAKEAARKKSRLVSLDDEDAVKEVLVSTVLNLWRQ